MGQMLCGIFRHKVRVGEKQYVVVKDVGEGGNSAQNLIIM